MTDQAESDIASMNINWHTCCICSERNWIRVVPTDIVVRVG